MEIALEASDRECHRGRKNFARLSKLRRQRHGARRSIVGLAAFFPVVGEGVARFYANLGRQRSPPDETTTTCEADATRTRRAYGTA